MASIATYLFSYLRSKNPYITLYKYVLWDKKKMSHSLIKTPKYKSGEKYHDIWTEKSKQAIRNDPFYYRIQNTNHN